jgi:hypothetical protein
VAEYEANTDVMIGLGELRLSNLSINFDMTVIECVTSSGGADSSVLRVHARFESIGWYKQLIYHPCNCRSSLSC